MTNEYSLKSFINQIRDMRHTVPDDEQFNLGLASAAIMLAEELDNVLDTDNYMKNEEEWWGQHENLYERL